MSNTAPVYLSIRIPVITARILLIATTVTSVIFGVLFPFSLLSFNYFYNILIPIPNIELPLSNYILNYDFSNIPPFVVIGKTLAPLYANQPVNQETEEVFNGFDFDLNYDFILKFDAFCQDDSKKYQTVMYKTSIVSSKLINQLSPYGTRPYIPKKFNLWPLTNNIHQLSNAQVLVSSMNTLVINCDDDTKKPGISLNEFFPPAFSWFIPPIISNTYINSRDTRFEVDLLSDLKFNDYLTPENNKFFENGDFNILLEFNKPNVIIDPSKSSISIDTAWKGLRYYLYHYGLISYVIGTLTLWIISSLILVSTISGLVIWRETSKDQGQSIDDDESENENNIKPNLTNPVVLKRDANTGKYIGTDPNLNVDLEIDVTEKFHTNDD